MSKVEFASSKKKIYLIILGTVIFTLSFLILFFYPNYFVSPVFRNVFFIKTVGCIGFLLFSWITLVLIIKLSKNEIGLKIDDFGILDNSNLVKIGLIEWKDIVKIEKHNLISPQFILIIVNNSEKYIEKAESKFQSFLIKSNLRMYGTPVTISSSLLNCSLDEL